MTRNNRQACDEFAKRWIKQHWTGCEWIDIKIYTPKEIYKEVLKE